MLKTAVEGRETTTHSTPHAHTLLTRHNKQLRTPNVSFSSHRPHPFVLHGNLY